MTKKHYPILRQAAHLLALDIDGDDLDNLREHLHPFLDVASAVAKQTGIESHIDSDVFDTILGLLTAHFARLANPLVTSSKEDGFSFTLQTDIPLEKGLYSTPFGQQAIVLDTTKKLMALHHDRFAVFAF